MKKNNAKKVAIILIVLALLIGGTIGGTIAYLMMATDPVTNTFTSSNVSITLTETKPADKTAKMVPGAVIEKNPTVTVIAGSETCYVFVKVDAANGAVLAASATANDYITYAMADGWEVLDATNYPGVYYREVAASNADQPFAVLAGNKVQVLNTVTKAMMNTAKTAQPTLTFAAYAIQKENVGNAAAAWDLVKNETPATNQ